MKNHGGGESNRISNSGFVWMSNACHYPPCYLDCKGKFSPHFAPTDLAIFSSMFAVGFPLLYGKA